ncbi:MAG TPA: YciI family protein [Cellvibrionaceae bacterium]
MFVVLLEFSANKAQAGAYMAKHNDWLQQGFDEEIFLFSGSLQSKRGGSILAHNISREALQERLSKDPFVAHNIVTVSILEITPGKADERLAFIV